MQNKTIILVLALAVLLGGGTIAYNALKENTAPDNLLESQISPAAQEESAAQSGQSSQPEKQDDNNNRNEQLLAPDFTVFDNDGNEVKLSDMRGKPIVLNFWASWCPPCKSEMPEFDKVYAELGADVQFMMVDAVDGSRETKEKGQAYVTKNGFSFPVYYDMDQNAIAQYGIRAFPTSIFIDKDGYIVTGIEGAIDEKTLRKGIEMIMPAIETTKAEYRKISADDAKTILDSSEEFILLDVRTEQEFNDGHIKDAILIPDYEITEKAAAELPDKNAKLLLYCRSGRRSAIAAKALIEMGYTNVLDFGGLLDWPYEVVKDEGTE